MRTHFDERGSLKKNKISFRELFLTLAGKRNPTDAGQRKVRTISRHGKRVTIIGQQFLFFSVPCTVCVFFSFFLLLCFLK